jgi:O-antigen/teichoic acid export membrane protein
VPDALTLHESSFRSAKARVIRAPLVRGAVLIGYRAFSDLAAKGSLFVITVFAARRLTQEAFGLFSLASTLGWMLTVAADFGIQLHVARAVSRDPSQARAILRRWLPARLASAGVTIGLVVAGIALTGLKRADAWPVLLLVLVYVCSGLIEFLHYFYRGLSRSDVESSLTLFQRLAMLACAGAVLAWQPNVTTLAIAMLLPVAVTLAVSVRIASRMGEHIGLGESSGTEHDRWREFSRDVFPIGAGIVLSALYFRIDLFLVQLWAGTESVALYNAVFRLVEALRLFPAAVLAVALPFLFRATDVRPLAGVSLGVTLFALAASSVLWATAEQSIPLVYGSRYADAVPAFRILVLAFPLMSLNYALTHQLIGWDRQRTYAVICGLALVFNIVLNARLIPALSISGAAWATVWTEVFLTMGCGAAIWSLRGRC